MCPLCILIPWIMAAVTLASGIAALVVRRFRGKKSNTEKQQKGEAMTKHKTGTSEEWRTARLKLLEAEKELTRKSDELALQRQALPWVQIDKEYQFETERYIASSGLNVYDGSCWTMALALLGEDTEVRTPP